MPSKQDWIQIHKFAWQNEEFRKLLEKDPAEAVKFWGILNYKQFASVMTMPKEVENPDDYTQPMPPPACC